MNKKSAQKKSQSGKSSDKKSLRPKIAEGFIHVRAIVEIVGKPKEYVEDALKEHLKKIRSEEGIEILEETSEKAEPHDNFFSAFAEIEFLSEDFDTLFTFCFDYMPSSVEIIDPEAVTLKNNQITDMLNDIQTRMHSLNTGYIEEKESSQFYIKNTAVLLRNFIVVLIASKPMKISEMIPYLGIREVDVEKVLEILVKEGKVSKDKDYYKVIPAN